MSAVTLALDVILNREVQLQRSLVLARQPEAAGPQAGRFRDFTQPEDAQIKGPRLVLRAARDGQRGVVGAEEAGWGDGKIPDEL